MLEARESEFVGCTDNEQHHHECHQARQDHFHADAPDFLNRTPGPSPFCSMKMTLVPTPQTIG
jgi:hypothetical protein